MDPHKERTRAILHAYPEIKNLFGNSPWTSIFIFGSVFIQISLAFMLESQGPLMILLCAYVLGAVINHGIWALVHELTHDLVFKSARLNKTLLLIANFPLFFPSTLAFRKYHMNHHRQMGVPDYDADLPANFEKNFVGRSSFRKMIWLLFYFAFQSARIMYVKKIKLWDRWNVINWLTQLGFLIGVNCFLGPWALVYLFLSAVFSIGLHPVGARWIQEHYLIREDQETYSYYGPMNWLSYNVGYHNEHHDLMNVPWHRLKAVREMAAPYYKDLCFHKSWTKLLFRFLLDPQLNLNSRRTR